MPQSSHAIEHEVTGGDDASVLLSQLHPPLPEAEVRHTIESIGHREFLRRESGTGL